MTLLSSYPPFLSVLWTMAVFFAWIIWFWLLITVFSDLFRRHDASGFTKVLWMIFVIIVPYLGVFIYLIANHDGMTERAVKDQQAAQQQLDDHIRSVAPAELDRGDREGQAAARQRRHQPGRVRIPQGKGAGRGLRPTRSMASVASAKPTSAPIVTPSAAS